MRRVSSRSASWKPGSGRTIPMFVSAGSASTQATSPCASAALERVEVVELDDRVVAAGSTGGPMLPARATTCPVGSVDERLVDRAVVAPVEDEDLRPPGDGAREPDREAVRVGRGQRELPAAAGRSGASSSSPTHDRVLGRQHERDPAARLLGDRLERRPAASGRSSRPCRRGRSRRTRAVDVAEARARAPRRRRAGSRPAQRIIQCIGTPREERRRRPLGQLARPRMLALGSARARARAARSRVGSCFAEHEPGARRHRWATLPDRVTRICSCASASTSPRMPAISSNSACAGDQRRRDLDRPGRRGRRRGRSARARRARGERKPRSSVSHSSSVKRLARLLVLDELERVEEAGPAQVADDRQVEQLRERRRGTRPRSSRTCSTIRSRFMISMFFSAIAHMHRDGRRT